MIAGFLPRRTRRSPMVHCWKSPATVPAPRSRTSARSTRTARGKSGHGSAACGAPSSRGTFVALDEALGKEDAEGARRAAVRAHVGLSTVAVRAAELGRPEVALDTAELVLAAEPTSVEARVAALAAADLAGDD